MFTGITTDIGTVAAIERRGDLRVTIATGYDSATIDIGASIACSGVCLTVVDLAPGRFAVDVSAETEARSVAARWTVGARLNLERALKLGDELGGHIVTGHVDGVGSVVAVADEGGSRRLRVRVPSDIAGHVAAKGSITLDGVSLTVNIVDDEAEGTALTVNIIPHTGEVTTLGALDVGDEVNLEIDVLSRYLKRLLSHRDVIAA